MISTKSYHITPKVITGPQLVKNMFKVWYYDPAFCNFWGVVSIFWIGLISWIPPKIKAGGDENVLGCDKKIGAGPYFWKPPGPPYQTWKINYKVRWIQLNCISETLH